MKMGTPAHVVIAIDDPTATEVKQALGRGARGYNVCCCGTLVSPEDKMSIKVNDAAEY